MFFMFKFIKPTVNVCSNIKKICTLLILIWFSCVIPDWWMTEVMWSTVTHVWYEKYCTVKIVSNPQLITVFHTPLPVQISISSVQIFLIFEHTFTVGFINLNIKNIIYLIIWTWVKDSFYFLFTLIIFTSWIIQVVEHLSFYDINN
jgi:hypothetical protein